MCDPRASARAGTELASRERSDGTASEQVLFATRLAPDEPGFGGYRPGNGVTYDCLANGEYTLFVRARDEAGNESDTATFTFKKDVPDAAPPSITTLEGPSGVNRNGSVSFKWGGADSDTPDRCLDYASRLVGRENDFSPSETPRAGTMRI